MSKKLPMPVYDEAADPYKYQLRKDYTYEMACNLPDFTLHSEPSAPTIVATLQSNVLTIQSGYSWDGCSFLTVDTRNTRAPCLIHDALCQMLNRGQKSKGLGPFTRAHSNCIHKQFHAHLRANGMNRFRAWYWLKAVQIGWMIYD